MQLSRKLFCTVRKFRLFNMYNCALIFLMSLKLISGVNNLLAKPPKYENMFGKHCTSVLKNIHTYFLKKNSRQVFSNKNSRHAIVYKLIRYWKSFGFCSVFSILVKKLTSQLLVKQPLHMFTKTGNNRKIS